MIAINLICFCHMMGRGKRCTPEKRMLIHRMHRNGQNPSEIARALGCSRNLVCNAIRIVKENPIHLLEKDPFKSARDIAIEINAQLGLNLSDRLV